MLFLGYHGASGYPQSHQKLIFCEYECNIRQKAAIKSGFGGFDFFIVLLCNSAYFQTGKLQKCSKQPKFNFSQTRPKAFLRQFFCTKWSFWSKEMIFIDFKPKNHILKDKFDFWHQNAQRPK